MIRFIELKVIPVVILPINSCPHNSRQQGLTLIEVLIALAIIGIALTAIIKSTSQNIRGTSYLADKTMALWVAQDVMNRAQVGLLSLPDSDQVDESTTLLDREWYWQAKQETTPNKHIFKISVSVFAQEPNDDATPLSHLEGYTYHEK